MIKLKNTILVVLLILSSTLFGQGDQVLDGGKWKVIYHASTKTVEYKLNDETVLAGVYVKAKNQDEFLNSNEYESATVSNESVSDVFGAGQKYVIEYKKEGKPDLQQVFYFYADKEYFLTEAFIKSGTETSSNYIAPLYTTTQNSFLPRSAVNRVVVVPFDNDGFVRYSSWPLKKDSVSFEVTTMFNGTSRKGLVVGSIEHDTWKTGLRFSTSEDQYINKLECYGGITHKLTRDIDPETTSKEHGSIYGTSLKSPKLLVGLFDDWRHGMDEYGAANALVAPPRGWQQGTPFGWNSWGEMQTNVNYDGVLDISDYFKNTLQPNSFENDNTVYIGLDSWWNENFTDSQLRRFVGHCKDNGQNAGIYWGPFSHWGDNGDSYVEGTNGTYQYKDIYLYADGQVREIESRALDPTHPGTKMMMEYMIKRFQRLGFSYIKLDFINNGTLEADSFYEEGVTTGVQAYNSGMKFLSDMCGDTMFLALSIAPTFPSQYGNSKRMSCDTWGDMTENYGATGYELNSLSFGWWLDKVYDYNDADHLVLNGRSAGANRARITSGVITGIYMLGDNLSQAGSYIGDIAAREKAEEFATNPDINAIARLGRSFYPVEGYLAAAADRAENFFMLDTDECVYLAIFNYKISAKNGSIDLSRLGLTSSDVSSVKELWSGEAVELDGESLSYSIPFQDVKVYRFQKAGAGTGIHPSETKEQKLKCYVRSGSTLVVDSDEELKKAYIAGMDGKILPAPLDYSTTFHEISLDNFSSGIYVLYAITKSGTARQYKFVKY